MLTIRCLAACSIGAIAGAGVADHLPNTLNFQNQTGSRVTETNTPSGGNITKDVTFADFDKDGDNDVAVAIADGIFNSVRNKLYINTGGNFLEVTGPPIIPDFNTADLSRYVFFRDYDGDTWLDMCIANDDLAGGGPYKIYTNVQSSGEFSHFTKADLSFEATCGAISEDVDNDGDYDIYAGNYPGPDQDVLWLNDGAGNFSAAESGLRVPVDSDYTIDVAAGDLNGNGKLDLLVFNEFDPNFIYYNDKLGAGDQGVGDYRYGAGGTGGVVNLGSTAEGAMECGDFNNDMRLDYYHSNHTGVSGDRIKMNTGNDAQGRAIFTDVIPPPYVTSSSSSKISVGDLNDDGRVDIVVGIPNGRPAVLRNTSVNNVISFVDWSPASAFPAGTTHRAHASALFDTNGDGDIDVFLGGKAGDYLFENVASNELLKDAYVGGTLPALHNIDPVAVDGYAPIGAVDEYGITGIPSGAAISLVLNGSGDYLVELLDDGAGGAVVASLDRGADGIEEAFQYAAGANTGFTVRVTTIGGADALGDANGNGKTNIDDILAIVNNFGACGKICPEDIAPVGAPNGVVNIDDLFQAINFFGAEANPYVLEILSRSN